jgi:hypothetical protein
MDYKNKKARFLRSIGKNTREQKEKKKRTKKRKKTPCERRTNM